MNNLQIKIEADIPKRRVSVSFGETINNLQLDEPVAREVAKALVDTCDALSRPVAYEEVPVIPKIGKEAERLLFALLRQLVADAVAVNRAPEAKAAVGERIPPATRRPVVIDGAQS